MLIEVRVEMEYQICPNDAVLLLVEAADTDGQIIVESVLTVENASLSRLDAEYGIGQRVWAMIDGDRLALQYRAKVEIIRPSIAIQSLSAMSIHSLPSAALTSLRPSRFCPSDLFTNFTGLQFGHLEGGEKVAAIVQWVNAETAYVSGSSDVTTTAIETFNARQGVCRDFAHLLCTLLRAANIPARYVSVYGTDVQPPDFHAAVQVWLSGAWHLVDATGMSNPSGLVVIAAGRDAADVAFLETSQWVQMIHQSVTVATPTVL